MIDIDIKDNGLSFFVIIKGEIEIIYIKELKEKLTSLAEKNNKDIELDLSDVEYMDSSGVGILLNVLRILRQKGKRLYIRKLSDRVLSVLKLSSLTEMFD